MSFKELKTQDLESMLAAATPGPWEVETIPELRYSNGETWEELGHHVVYGENGPLFATDEQTVEDAEQYQDNEANIRLAAAAPTAVAEVVRLRQAMTRLRDTYAAPDDPGDDYGRGAEAAYQIAAKDLTRILEGEA